MKRILPALLLTTLLITSPLRAEEGMRHHMDDSVVFTVSSEDWVTTKTARVSVNVEAAVSDKNAGSMRADMAKAVAALAKGDWRLTSFSRSMDQTGLERWSANYEARIEEAALNGLADSAKKSSKAGMLLTVSDIDFSPTLDETEAAKAALRAKIYKQANDQLTTLNSTLSGRGYRIAQISFVPFMGGGDMAMPMVNRGGMMMKPMAMGVAAGEPAPSAERSEKIILTATVVLSAAAPTATPAK